MNNTEISKAIEILKKMKKITEYEIPLKERKFANGLVINWAPHLHSISSSLFNNRGVISKNKFNEHFTSDYKGCGKDFQKTSTHS